MCKTAKRVCFCACCSHRDTLSANPHRPLIAPPDVNAQSPAKAIGKWALSNDLNRVGKFAGTAISPPLKASSHRTLPIVTQCLQQM